MPKAVSIGYTLACVAAGGGEGAAQAPSLYAGEQPPSEVGQVCPPAWAFVSRVAEAMCTGADERPGQPDKARPGPYKDLGGATTAVI